MTRDRFPSNQTDINLIYNVTIMVCLETENEQILTLKSGPLFDKSLLSNTANRKSQSCLPFKKYQ